MIDRQKQPDPIRTLKTYVKILSVFVLLLTGICIWLLLGERKELTVERLNIVDTDGKLAMVISNKKRQHPGRMDNKDLPDRARPAGIIFFNDEGDECGGLIASGDNNGAGMSFTMDQYKNDQILQLSYDQQNNGDGKTQRYGLTLNDRDDLPLLKQMAYFDSLKKLNDPVAFKAGRDNFMAAGHFDQRLFLGKNQSGEVGLFLNDSKGQPRLRVYINAKNQPVMETIDESGQIASTKM